MYVDLTTVVSPDSPMMAWAKSQENPYVAMGHIGTHLDTYEKSEIPLAYFKSEGILLDVRDIAEVTPADIALEQIKEGDFVLFRTGRMEAHPYGDPTYFEDHPQLSHALIQKLTEKKIRFIGVDCPGIRRNGEHEAADRLCEKHGVYDRESQKSARHLDAPLYRLYDVA